jgi:hypothetical protein
MRSGIHGTCLAPVSKMASVQHIALSGCYGMPFDVIFDVRTEQKHLLTNQLLDGLLSLKKEGVLRSRNQQEDHEHPKRLWNASDS